MKLKLLVTAAFIELCLVLIVKLGDLQQNTVPFLFLYFAAFAACVFSYRWFRKFNKATLVPVLLFSALFRLTLLFSPPTHSKDVYRYIWDGMLTAHGINPYRFQPQDSALQGLQNSAAYRAMNSRAYFSVYPPTSQYLFLLAYKLFGENPLGLKIIFSSFDFAAVIILYLLLREFALPWQGLLLYAWNPLPLVEFSGSGHSDSGMLFFLLLSIYLLRRRHMALSMASLAVAVLSKLIPLVCVPFYLKKVPWRNLAALVLVFLVLLLPFLDLMVIKNYVRSVDKYYYRLFEFNAGLHYLIRHIGRTYYDAELNKRVGPVLRTFFLIFVIFLFFYHKMQNELDLMRLVFYMMIAALLLSTQVHPWYVTWALIFVPFFPKLSVLYLSGAVALSYLTYLADPWRERAWVLLVEYVPVYVLLVCEFIRGTTSLAARGLSAKCPMTGVEDQGARPEDRRLI